MEANNMKLFNSIEDLSILNPVNQDGLTLYPIILNNEIKMEGLELFDDLYDRDQVKALEIGEAGIVQEITLKNESLSNRKECN